MMSELIDIEADENEYPPEATVGDQWLRAPCQTSPRRSPLSSAELHKRIAEMAYRLFLSRGGCDGKDVDDWLKAERLVLSALSDRQN